MRHNDRERAPPGLRKKTKTLSAFMKPQIVEGAKVKRKSGETSVYRALYTYSLFTKVTVTYEELRL